MPRGVVKPEGMGQLATVRAGRGRLPGPQTVNELLGWPNDVCEALCEASLQPMYGPMYGHLLQIVVAHGLVNDAL